MSPPASPVSTNRPLRILHLADAIFEEKPGGSRQVARELLGEQVRSGHQPTILVGRQVPGAPERMSDPERGQIVQYARGNSPMQWIDNGQRACTQLLAEAEAENRPFDIVHTHFAYAAVGPLRAISGRIPHVRSFYGPWDVEGFVEDTGVARNAPSWKRPLLMARALLKRRYRHNVEKQNLHQSAQTIILSEQSRGEVLDFGYDSAKIKKIPAGVNRSRFFVDTSDPGARNSARKNAGLSLQSFPLLLSIRRLVPRMGLENLIAALPRVRSQFPDLQLVIGGRGPIQENLQLQAKSLGVTDVVLFAGFIPDDKIADYYRGADLFVLPTIALEGFGLVTVEALACGTPVIATPVGASPEIILDLEKRLLADGTTPDDLAVAILRFAEAKKKQDFWVNELSPQKLCDYVDQRYTWARHAAGVEEVYRSITRLNV